MRQQSRLQQQRGTFAKTPSFLNFNKTLKICFQVLKMKINGRLTYSCGGGFNYYYYIPADPRVDKAAIENEWMFCWVLFLHRDPINICITTILTL